jgi:hypothetical protein
MLQVVGVVNVRPSGSVGFLEREVHHVWIQTLDGGVRWSNDDWSEVVPGGTGMADEAPDRIGRQGS